MPWELNFRGVAQFVAAAATASSCGSPASAAPQTNLPGSADFPLVEGSAIAACPKEDIEHSTAVGTVCVTMPNDEKGHAIIDTYQRQLEERGFHPKQYMGSPNVLLLTKGDGANCEWMIFGLPYLPPEQRNNLLLEFQVFGPSPDGCNTP